MRRLFFILTIIAIFTVAGLVPAQESPNLEGHWLGKISVSAIEMRLIINVKAKEGGGYTGTMDSIDQGVRDIPIPSMSLEGNQFTFTLPALQGKYEGTLNEAADTIDGKWTQGGVTLPLKLEKKTEEELPKYNRPQELKPPFPYRAIEVTYPNESAEGVTLAGTLTLPEGDGPFPAVVMISGSGPQNRDEELLGHKPFLVIADYLTRRGIAVLRFDDRGVARSTGDPMKATSEDFATDALAGVAFLKTRDDIRHDRVGLIGHSEGGIIAPMAAADSSDIAFIVLMAGTGVSGAEVLSLQAVAISRAMGASEEELENVKQMQKEMASILASDEETAALRPKLEAVLRKSVESLPPNRREELGDAGAFLTQQADQLLAPWFRYFMTYDPKTELRKVKCPVLAINGELDLQVIPSQNLPAIAAALEEGGNRDYTIIKFPGLNHLFQHCTTGSPTEYAKIEETISPDVLETMGNWIAHRVK